MHLLSTLGNPIPDGAEELTVETRDGVRLRAALWPSEGSDRGTVLILQGRAEFIEKYFEVVAELRSRGWAVVAFDWRGQGGSGRLLADPHRGHVRHFSDFQHDLAAVQAAIAARQGPHRSALHVLAHSMGGCIALTAAADGLLQADSLVALTPMLGLSLVERPALARGLSGLLNLIGLGELSVPGGRTVSISTMPFEGNLLCADRARYDRNAALAEALGPRAIGSPTIGWVAAAFEAMKRLEGDAATAAIRLPVLLVAAGDDPICSTPAIELFAQRLPNAELLVVAGARHEILHETDDLRSIFWAAFDTFLSQHASAPSRVAAPSLALSC